MAKVTLEVHKDGHTSWKIIELTLITLDSRDDVTVRVPYDEALTLLEELRKVVRITTKVTKSDKQFKNPRNC